MIVDLATHLDAAPETIWNYVTRPATFVHVSWPVMIFVSRERGGFPERWQATPHRVWKFAFGFIPYGAQTIHISYGPHEDGVQRLRDAGVGWVARVWDHHISVTPDGDGALYRDRVRVEAGLLTPCVWMFAALFFRWRQMRWRAPVKRGFKSIAA